MDKLRRNKTRSALVLAACVAGMAGLSFAAVPLYQIFCQVTGYGGTTQVAEVAPDTVIERTIDVRFNADVNRELAWRFRPMQRSVEVHPGESHLAFYEAINESDRPILGQAAYNVTPQKAGIYFTKIACFCFTEQYLAPGERAEMPVTFFIDPEIVNDRNMNDLGTITLSYTFFDLGQEALDEYLEERGRIASRAADDAVNDANAALN
jgi:cytochrome c oxidase assembly protein subunit 11